MSEDARASLNQFHRVMWYVLVILAEAAGFLTGIAIGITNFWITPAIGLMAMAGIIVLAETLYRLSKHPARIDKSRTPRKTMNETPNPWRDPYEESYDLYPGLVVHDSRVTGSITAGRSRLPLWAFAGAASIHGWGEAEEYRPEDHGWTAQQHAEFIHNLLETRGEFGRLLLVLANAERHVYQGPQRPWWEDEELRRSVIDQLRRCLTALGEDV